MAIPLDPNFGNLPNPVRPNEDENGVIIIQFLDDGGNIIQEVPGELDSGNPYEFNVSRFLPNTRAFSLNTFYSLSYALIRDAQVQAGINPEDIIVLSEEYPPEPFDSFGDEIICFRLLKREPGKMDRKGTDRPHRKATFSYKRKSPQYPNKVITVESRPVDHIIEFTCWAKSNKLANSRAMWLEKLFINNAFIFEVEGAERFFWRDRGPDTYTTTNSQRLFYRPVNFFLRFREFEAKADPTIRRVLLEGAVN